MLDEILKTPVAVLLIVVLALAGIICVILSIFGKIPQIQFTGKGKILPIEFDVKQKIALIFFGALLVTASLGLAVVSPAFQETKARQELLPTISVLETKIAEPTGTPSREEIVVTHIVTQMVPVTPTLIPTSTMSPYTIDPMDILSNWKPAFCNDDCGKPHGNGASSMLVTLVPGQTTEAIEILYDVKEAGWVLITRNVSPQTLSGTTGLEFSYKGNGAPNTIELKLLLRYPGDLEDTAFGALFYGASDTDDHWTHVEALYSKDFTCMFPEELCDKHSNVLDLTAVKRIDIAVSHKSGDTAGLGRVTFDDLVGITP